MNILQAFILGIVQGLTELLPISSSAHLNLFPWVFHWGQLTESFDVALHIGTLFAILLFFYKDWISLIKGGYQQVVKKEKTTEGRIFWYIVISTIPAGILSLVLDKLSEKIIEGLSTTFQVEKITVEMVLIAIALIVMGVLLYRVDKKSKSKITYEKISLKQSILISTSQALAAAFPGVSRSGITMTVGRKMEIERESVAKYSFLLSTPIVAAAALYEMKHFTFDLSFLIGVLTSFIVGLFVIKFLLNYLKKGSFKIFAIYRVLLGIIILMLCLIR